MKTDASIARQAFGQNRADLLVRRFLSQYRVLFFRKLRDLNNNFPKYLFVAFVCF
jgi:hypothetical protein